MSWLCGLEHRLRTAMRPGAHAGEVEDEMRFHVELVPGTILRCMRPTTRAARPATDGSGERSAGGLKHRCMLVRGVIRTGIIVASEKPTLISQISQISQMA